MAPGTIGSAITVPIVASRIIVWRIIVIVAEVFGSAGGAYIVAALHTPLIDVWSPIWSHIGADMTAAGAYHPRAERPDRCLFRQVVGVYGDAVIAVDRAAIDQQVSAAVGADMPESYRLERLALLAGHWLHSSSASRFTAGAFGFFDLIQCGDRPELYGESRRFDTIPSRPSSQARRKTSVAESSFDLAVLAARSLHSVRFRGCRKSSLE
jgi:hypothetical protein